MHKIIYFLVLISAQIARSYWRSICCGLGMFEVDVSRIMMSSAYVISGGPLFSVLYVHDTSRPSCSSKGLSDSTNSNMLRGQPCLSDRWTRRHTSVRLTSWWVVGMCALYELEDVTTVAVLLENWNRCSEPSVEDKNEWSANPSHFIYLYEL